MQRNDTDSKNKEKQVNKKVVIDLALDPRTPSGKIRETLFSASAFGKLKDVELINAVPLCEKISNNKFYLYELEHPEGMLSKEQQKDLETYHALKKAIDNNDPIIIFGHCNTDFEYLSSANAIQVTPDTLIRLFPTNMANKNIDIIACKGNAFGTAFAKKLIEKSQTTQLKCDGITISTRTYVTFPLPNGDNLYFKMGKNGFPKVFTVGSDYRQELLIQKNQVVKQNISHQKDKKTFRQGVDDYRNSTKKSAENLKKRISTFFSHREEKYEKVPTSNKNQPSRKP